MTISVLARTITLHPTPPPPNHISPKIHTHAQTHTNYHIQWHTNHFSKHYSLCVSHKYYILLVSSNLFLEYLSEYFSQPKNLTQFLVVMDPGFVRESGPQNYSRDSAVRSTRRSELLFTFYR